MATYQQVKVALCQQFDFQNMQNQDFSKNNTREKNHQKLIALLLIHSFSVENWLVRAIMEHQQRYYKETAFKAHQDFMAGNCAAVMDANPLQVYSDFKQLRGQFHRKPTRVENRYFRIRKCARDINLLEFLTDTNDFRFAYDHNSIKVNNVIVSNMYENQDSVRSYPKLNIEQLVILGHYGLRPLEGILIDFKERLSIFKINWDENSSGSSGNGELGSSNNPRYCNNNGNNWNTQNINTNGNDGQHTGNNNNGNNNGANGSNFAVDNNTGRNSTFISRDINGNLNYYVGTYMQHPIENQQNNTVFNHNQPHIQNASRPVFYTTIQGNTGANMMYNNGQMGTGKENRNRLFSSGEKNFCNQQQNNKNQECYQLGRANQN